MHAGYLSMENFRGNLCVSGLRAQSGAAMDLRFFDTGPLHTELIFALCRATNQKLRMACSRRGTCENTEHLE